MFSVFVFKISSLQSSNRRAHLHESHRTYGTALWGGLILGTSCQATIRLSLRDKSHSPIVRPGDGSVAVGAEDRKTEHRRDANYHCCALASGLPKVVGRRGVLPSRNVQTSGSFGPAETTLNTHFQSQINTPPYKCLPKCLEEAEGSRREGIGLSCVSGLSNMGWIKTSPT
jgi:hypothetical protein